MDAQDKNLLFAKFCPIPLGRNDNDPELLEAMEKAFNKRFEEFKALAAGVTDLDMFFIKLFNSLNMPDSVKMIVENKGYEGMEELEVDQQRIVCIDKWINALNQLYSNGYPIRESLAIKQFIAYLERKKDPDNDYILPLDIINKLHEINLQNHYWKDETPEAWRKRFKKIVKDIIPFDQRKDVLNPDAYHTMIKEAADRAKKDNKIKNTYNDFALLRFGYSKFHHKQNANRYKRAVYTNISTLF